MNMKITRTLAVVLIISSVFALPGCSFKTKKTDQTNASTAHVEISEIDALVNSVNKLKGSFDNKKIVKGEVEEVVAQIMVLEGFLDENPALYQDSEYKGKISSIYNTLKTIDVNQEGLQKDDGVDKIFNGLMKIVERVNGKIK